MFNAAVSDMTGGIFTDVFTLIIASVSLIVLLLALDIILGMFGHSPVDFIKQKKSFYDEEREYSDFVSRQKNKDKQAKFSVRYFGTGK